MRKARCEDPRRTAGEPVCSCHMCCMPQGGNLWKHGRQGKPKVHYFHLTDADTCLTWMSKDTKNRSVRLRDVENVRHCPAPPRSWPWLRVLPGPEVGSLLPLTISCVRSGVWLGDGSPSVRRAVSPAHVRQHSGAGFITEAAAAAPTAHGSSLGPHASVRACAADLGSGDGDLQAVSGAGARPPVVQRHVPGGRLAAVAGLDLRDGPRLRVLVLWHQGARRRSLCTHSCAVLVKSCAKVDIAPAFVVL